MGMSYTYLYTPVLPEKITSSSSDIQNPSSSSDIQSPSSSSDIQNPSSSAHQNASELGRVYVCKRAHNKTLATFALLSYLSRHIIYFLIVYMQATRWQLEGLAVDLATRGPASSCSSFFSA